MFHRHAGATTLLLALIWSIGSIDLEAQHAYTAEELAMGGRLFDSNCAACHGTGGDAIAGADLTTGTFRQAADDEAFVALVRSGIEGTSMPPVAVSTEEAGLILAYLYSLAGIDVTSGATEIMGDPAGGRALVESSGCLNCHRINGEGGTRGPDLTRVGATPQGGGRGFVPPGADELRARLRTALVDPDAEVRPANQSFRVTMGEETLTGRLLNHDTHTVSILVDGASVRTFVLEDLDDFGVVGSPMPSFDGRLSDDEIDDVVSYLQTLDGQ